MNQSTGTTVVVSDDAVILTREQAKLAEYALDFAFTNEEDDDRAEAFRRVMGIIGQQVKS